jgi:hypothetical protein
VPALLLHNPHDELVPLAEGKRVRDALLGAPMPTVWPVAETYLDFAWCAGSWMRSKSWRSAARAA